jgi:two-component system, chemotaxis family, protein-glutamate methylesterase/glutaminase
MRLPARVHKTPEPASLVCPDCGGALAVQAEGNAAYLMFVCQVGHSYSTAMLVSGKEERLEEVLWSGVYLIEELADLLGDLVARGGPDGRHREWPAAVGRIRRLREQASRLREVLSDNEPIDLAEGVASERDTT